MKKDKTQDKKLDQSISNHSLQMMTDRVLVIPSNEEGERATRGGLLIPATANDDKRLRWGEVVSIGRNVHHVREGDKILYAPDAGFTCEIGGESYLLLRERDIQAISQDSETKEPGLYL